MNTGCHPDFKDPPSRPRTGANPGQTPNEHPTYRVRVSPPPPRTWRDSQRPATVVSPGQIRDHSVKGRARPRRAAPDSAPHQNLGAKPQPTRSMGPYRPTAGTREGPPRSLAGKPLAGFRATPSRRIPVLYGMVVYAIRFNNQLLHRQPTLRKRRLGENWGFRPSF